VAANVRKAITEVLLADGPLSTLLNATAENPAIWHRTAPQDAPMPFVLLFKQAGTPSYTFGDLHEDEVWTVKAVDRETSADTVEAIDERLRALLADAPLAIDGNTVLWCRREEDVSLNDVEEGVIYHQEGAMYRIIREPS
jgi:hypothetical protein